MQHFLSPMTGGDSGRRQTGSSAVNALSQSERQHTLPDEQTAVEQSKKSFLQAWSEYIEAVKKNTEISERQQHLAKYEDRLAEYSRQALARLGADVSTLPVNGKVEYKHLPSLIENARSYTTNPKYAEWQPGILNALPHLEEALQKLHDLEIPTAEKDIIDAVRIAVNTPFMQMIKCKDKQREMHQALLSGMPEASYASSLQSLYNEFLVNHRERKVRQALELVKRLETGIKSADANFNVRLDAYGDVKKNMNANFDSADPLNIEDYEPPHEQAIAALEAKIKEVLENKERWSEDFSMLRQSDDPDNILGVLKKQAADSSNKFKNAKNELDGANDDVKKCWDALMEAQKRASLAEKQYISAKLQDEIDNQLVTDVSALVAKNKELLEISVKSCDQYCEVLKCVEKYINTRWDPWKEIVKSESKILVAEVCEVFSISEQVLGDLIDRKKAQVDHAAKEEKECMDKYLSKWETLDPGADKEKERANESQKVKEAAQAEAEHYIEVRQGLRDVLELCRPTMEYFSMSIDGVEKQAWIEEWDKKRIRLYNELESLAEPLVKKINVLGQTADKPSTSSISRPLLPVDGDLKRINAYLLMAPENLSLPVECGESTGITEKQRKTASDMIVRVDHILQEIARQAGQTSAENAAKTLEMGLEAIKQFLNGLKSGPAISGASISRQSRRRTPVAAKSPMTVSKV